MSQRGMKARFNGYNDMKRFCLILLGILLLSACTREKVIRFYITPTPVPEQIKQEQAPGLMEQLRQQGIGVIQEGDTMRIILPSDQIFNPHSANLSARAKVLDTVACLMLLLQTTSAEVAGYTNAGSSHRVNQALSEKQAHVVEDYIWTKGVDVRVLYTKGYGASQPLSANSSSPVNRRVEIRFQYIPWEVGR